MTTISTAICSFCSREDSNVKVVCRKYCLICRRCQLLPATRQLIAEHCKISVHNSNNLDANDVQSDSNNGSSKGCCPICSSTMTKNMFFLIQGNNDDISEQDNILIELDLGHSTSPLIDFISYYNNMYGSIGYEIKLEQDLPLDGVSDSNPNRRMSTASRLSALSNQSDLTKQTPTSLLGAQKHAIVSQSKISAPIISKQQLQSQLAQKKTAATDVVKDYRIIPAPNKAQKDSSYDVYATFPVTLSHAEGLSIFSECLVTVWQSFIQGCEDSISVALKKVVIRKKATNRSNDFRLKSFLDYVLMSNAANSSNKSSTTILLGKLLGLYPKITETIRPILGSITTSIILLCYVGDRIIQSRNKELYDSVKSFPSAQDFRNKIDKLSNVRLISVRKALQIISHLINIQEPHWCMSPLAASSMLVGGRLAWEADSISRLIHMIIYTLRGDVNLRSNVNESASLLVEESDNEITKDMPTDLDNGGEKRSPSRRSSYATDRKKSCIPAPNIQQARNLIQSTILTRLQQLPIKAAEFWRAIPHPSWKETVDFASFGSIVHTDQLQSPSSIHQSPHVTSAASTSMMRSPNAAGMRGRNAAFTNNNTNSNTGGSPRTPYRNHTPRNSSDEYMVNDNKNDNDFNSSAYYESAKEVAKNTGKGIISPIDFDKASTLIPPDMMMSPTELSLICIAAWEAEYERVIQIQSNSMIVTHRRAAIKGTFNPSEAQLTFPNKLLLRRIITWYKTVFYPELQRKLMLANNKDGDHDYEFDAHAMTWNPSSSIDWGIIKALAKDRLLPFTVPASLYSKSPAELNYYSSQLQLEEAQRRSKDMMEDELHDSIMDDDTLDSQSTCTNPMLAGIRLRNGVKIADHENHKKSEVIDEIAAYSVGKTLPERLKISVHDNQTSSLPQLPNNDNESVISAKLMLMYNRQTDALSESFDSCNASPRGLLSARLSPRAIKPTLLSKSRKQSILKQQQSSVTDIHGMLIPYNVAISSRMQSRSNSAYNSRANSRVSSPRPLSNNNGMSTSSSSKQNSGMNSPQPTKKSLRVNREIRSSVATKRPSITMPNRASINLAADSLSLQEQHIKLSSRSIRSSPKVLFGATNASNVGIADVLSRSIAQDDIDSAFQNAMMLPVKVKPKRHQRFKAPAGEVIRTTEDMLSSESSASIQTNPNRSVTSMIPGARGSMYPRDDFYSQQPGQFHICLPDIIDNHPNLLTKANLLVSNTLMIDKKHGGLKFDSVEPIENKFLFNTMQNARSTKPTPRQTPRQIIVDHQVNLEEMVANYSQRLRYTSNTDTISKSQDDIFYKTINHMKCPPIGSEGGHKRDRQNIMSLSGYQNTNLYPTSPKQNMMINGDASVNDYMSPKGSDFGVSPHNREYNTIRSNPSLCNDDSMSLDNLTKLVSHADIMTITSQQYIESFSFEFSEFIRSIHLKPLHQHQQQADMTSVHHQLSSKMMVNPDIVDNNSSFEALVTQDSFILRQINLSNPDNFYQIVNRFLDPHVPVIQKLSLENLSIGYYGSLILNASKLSQSSSLTELNISGNNLGDRGVIAILESLSIKNETKVWLTSLNLRNNGMAFANEGLQIIQEFPYLMHLDMSYNRISLDIQKQRSLFYTVFSSMRELKYLSLAYNTLQDNIFDILTPLIQHNNFIDLEILDLAKCYITSASISNIQKVLYYPSMAKFRMLLLQQNIFTNDEIHTLKFKHKFKQDENGTIMTMSQKESVAISSTDGFIVTISEPINKVTKVVLYGEYHGIDKHVSNGYHIQ